MSNLFAQREQLLNEKKYTQRESNVYSNYASMENNIAVESNLYLTHNEQFCDYAEEGEDDFRVDSDDEADVYDQLAQKEKYLLIAAEAGKALLEQNETLQEKMLAMHEEYQNKMDELHQDKHFLKKQLSQREEHYESSIQDLQNEVQNLGLQLNGVQKVSQTFEKSQKQNIQDILLQNETLATQLQQMNSCNQQLSFQVGTLKKRIEGNSSATSGLPAKINDRMESVEIASLKRKINDLEQHNTFLEESIGELELDKDSLTVLCRKANEDNEMLAHKYAEAEQQFLACQSELHDSKSSNCTMKDQLEEYMVQASLNSTTNNSLFNEIKETSMCEIDLSLCTQLQGQSPGRPIAQSSAYSLQTLKRPRPLSSEILEDDDGEFVIAGGMVSMAVESAMRHPSVEHEKLLDEMQEVYQRIVNLHQEMLPGSYYAQQELVSGSVLSADDIFKSGHLLCAVDRLCKALQDSKSMSPPYQQSPPLPRSGASSNAANDDGSDTYSVTSDSQASQIELYEQQMTELNGRLNETMKEWEASKKSGALLLLESKEKDAEINSLTQRVNFLGRELKSMQDERELLLADLSDESKLKQAINDRKESITRENNLSLELEQLKYDMMKLNDQLLESVQQKYQLSEQLEQWQVDMASMIEKQLASKMKGESKTPSRKHRSSLFPGKWNWGISPSKFGSSSSTTKKDATTTPPTTTATTPNPGRTSKKSSIT